MDQYRERSVERPDVNAQNPDVQVQVFVHEGQGTVNMDTSVLPLHMRGYRRESVEAPIRETLAAHMLHMAGIPQHFRFFDEVRQSTVGLIPAHVPTRRSVVTCDTTRHDTTRHAQATEATEGLVLHDPMCGSGTILAEAALMATQTPAAFLREKWYILLRFSLLSVGRQLTRRACVPVCLCACVCRIVDSFCQA